MKNHEKKSERLTLPRFCDNVYKLMKRHPYITLVVLCAIFGLSTGCASENINFLIIPAVLWATIVSAVFFRGYFSLNLKAVVVTVVITLLYLAGSAVLLRYMSIGYQFVRMGTVLFSTVLLLLLWRNKKLNVRTLLAFVIILWLIMRVAAVLEINTTAYQHDVGLFSDSIDKVYTYTDKQLLTMEDHGAGHAAYIEFIFHHYYFPDFDMRNVWSFYNPPFFHIISALWLHIAVLVMDYSAACESVQVIPLFCSCALVLLFVRFFRQLGLKGKGLLIATAIAATSNTFIHFSINVNNDPLATLFMMAALVFAVDWFSDRKFSTIMKTSICVGLGMMTKLSAATIAFPIAFLFVWVFFGAISKKEKIGKYLGQFSAFLGLCVPLAFWWQVRNLIRFGIPLSYVQTVDDELPEQFIGNIPVLQRLFGFSADMLSRPWVHTLSSFGLERYTENEYNPLISLIKTSLFEEYRQNGLNAPVHDMIAAVLIVITLLLGTAALIMMIYKVFSSKGNERVLHIMMCVAYFSMMISYYSFCFKYPYACSQHIRYVPLVIVIGAAYIGFLLSAFRDVPVQALRTPKKLSRNELISSVATILLTVITAVFAYGQIMIF